MITVSSNGNGPTGETADAVPALLAAARVEQSIAPVASIKRVA
jgi:hypothetical protein